LETVKDHYDAFLGSVYSWILGDFDTAARRSANFFDSIDLKAQAGAVAVDLGCGPGCQSLPLARLGFDVLAVDFCQALLDELSCRADGLRVRAVCDDLAAFRSHMSEPAELIVCMGDTLVHLPDEDAVLSVLSDVCQSLSPGGQFIYAIRDYFSNVPQGADRFIPIRSSEDQVFTCFLDYRDTTVHVHDILQRKVGSEWHMTISDYPKLRLHSETIDRQLERGGLRMTSKSLADGMIVGIAERPA